MSDLGKQITKNINKMKANLQKTPSQKGAAKQLNKENAAGKPISQEVWDLDRSTPMGALKYAMRMAASPEVLEGKTVQGFVVDNAVNIPSMVEASLGALPKTVQLIRVCVTSDPRHYWIPTPKNPMDNRKAFFPVVKHIMTTVKDELSWGQFIEIEFIDNKTQFTSHMEVGTVTKVLDNSAFKDFSDTDLITLGEQCQVIWDKNVPSIENCGVTQTLTEFPTPSESDLGVVEDRGGVKAVSPHKPTTAHNITSKYNPARTLRGKTRPHRGTDYSAPIGTPIFAALDGVISFHTNAGNDPTDGYGYYATIKHTKYATSMSKIENNQTDIFFTLYAHMQNYNAGEPGSLVIKKSGDKVKAGELIGLSAQSGRTDPPRPDPAGAHLHFEYSQASGGEWSAGHADWDPEKFFFPKVFYFKDST